MNLLKRRNVILEQIVDEHERTLNPNNPGDFLDALIDVPYVLLDVYLGGIDTFATSMEFFACVMANNPDIQKKIHQEIDSVIGKENQQWMMKRSFIICVQL
jgi:hypothetical protein